MRDRKFSRKTWFFLIIAVVLTLATVFITQVTSFTIVSGNSMLPTLGDSDRYLVQRRFYTLSHGDIVVIDKSHFADNGESIKGDSVIKRVIGLSGDELRFDTENGVIYRNGAALEVAQSDGVWREAGYTISGLTYDKKDLPETVTVPYGCIFVLGDNRGNSEDSRNSNVGMVGENWVIGKVLFRVN